jgi:hypothetical protein
LKIHFNIILPSMPGSPKWFVDNLLRINIQTPVLQDLTWILHAFPILPYCVCNYKRSHYLAKACCLLPIINRTVIVTGRALDTAAKHESQWGCGQAIVSVTHFHSTANCRLRVSCRPVLLTDELCYAGQDTNTAPRTAGRCTSRHHFNQTGSTAHPATCPVDIGWIWRR